MSLLSWKFIKVIFFEIKIGEYFFILLFLFLLTDVKQVYAQSQTVNHSINTEFGINFSGENVFNDKGSRFATNFLTLGYSRDVLKERNKGLQGSHLSVKTEILSSFYIPIVYSFLKQDRAPFTDFEAYAPNVGNILVIDYRIHLSNSLSVGLVFHNPAFNHGPTLFNPSKVALGPSFSFVPLSTRHKLNFEFSISRTLRTPTFNRIFPPSPYNAYFFEALVNWHLLSKKRSSVFAAVKYLQMIELGSVLEPDQGYFYRIDVGYRLSLSKKKQKG